MRYEEPQTRGKGVHSSQPTALIEDNQIHGNGYRGSSLGGVSMDDAQNATFRNNFFGPRTISRVSYAANNNGRAIVFGDSGRTTAPTCGTGTPWVTPWAGRR